MPKNLNIVVGVYLVRKEYSKVYYKQRKTKCRYIHIAHRHTNRQRLTLGY